MGSLSRALVIAGVALLAVGVLLQLAPSIPLLGKLPGDILIERPGFRLYLPLTSCVVISLIASGALWLVSHMR